MIITGWGQVVWVNRLLWVTEVTDAYAVPALRCDVLLTGGPRSSRVLSSKGPEGLCTPEWSCRRQ